MMATIRITELIEKGNAEKSDRINTHLNKVSAVFDGLAKTNLLLVL